jgi:hypothetical protein
VRSCGTALDKREDKKGTAEWLQSPPEPPGEGSYFWPEDTKYGDPRWEQGWSADRSTVFVIFILFIIFIVISVSGSGSGGSSGSGSSRRGECRECTDTHA